MHGMMEIKIRIDEPEELAGLSDAAGADSPTPPAGVSDLVRAHEPTAPVDSYQPPTAPASLDQPPSVESGSPTSSRKLQSATRHTSLAPDIVHGGQVNRGVR